MAEDPKTIEARRRKDSAPRTVQMPSGADRGVAPAMPTVAAEEGAPVPVGAPPAMPPARYQVGVEIARGGMGRVVEATDTLLGRTVAIKEALGTEPEALRRFARETRITARLEHPSIVPVHDAGRSPTGSPYYVMRKVSGRPLERLVAAADTLEKRLALLPHVVAAAQAVAHAHSRGIVHRDIKPSNILIGDFGETILIDWGLAKVIGEPDDASPAPAPPADPDDESLRTKAGIVYGTPGFMSPEQLRGALVDERCDVYALGATLYHLLARKPPHHAKTADDMMKAAMAGPPKSLAELVPGVPPELSTIVEKALAQDPQIRYPNATSLAEDLVRFLTGQLVASHHYSPRERLIRFVRRNRVPVAVTVAAGIVLAIVGAVAVRRVVNERDRADEQARIALDEKREAEKQRNEAEKRADDITLAQARTLVDADPTATVAMIKPLATKRWREVRAIAAAARASGVSFDLVASAKTPTLEISRDGVRALAAGDDGSVRLHDLAHRTTRELAHLGGSALARFADDDRRVLAANGTDVVIVDVANGVKRSVRAATPITDLAAVGTIAYWIDNANALWQLDLAKSDPVRIPIDEPVRALRPSPDGRWLALAGDAHLLLLDRTQPSAPPISMTDGDTRHMAWSVDGAHLAALVDEQAVDVEMAPAPTVVHKLTVGRRFQVAYDNGRLYTVGPTGIGILPPAGVAHKQVTGTPIGLRVARGSTIVAAGNQGLITVLSDDGDAVLRAPSVRILAIEASPRSPYVIAIVDDTRLLVWNLDDIQPRRVTSAQPVGAGFVGADQVIASFGADAPTQWIDLRTGHAVGVGTTPALLATAAAPDGRIAIAIDLTHHARVVGPGREPQDLDGAVDFARFLDDDRAIIGSADGKLELQDIPHKRRMPLVARKAPLLGVAASRTAIAAVFGDGTLWRHDVASGVDTTLEVKPPPTGPVTVLADGAIAYAADRELRIWRGDRAMLQAGLARAIDKLAAIDGGILAVTTDGTAHVVGTSMPTVVSYPAGPAASVSAETGLIIVLSREGTIEVIDPTVKQRWPLATAGVVPFMYPQISPDGRHVFALTRRGLLVWTLDLPGADDTRKWLDAMTNVTPGSR